MVYNPDGYNGTGATYESLNSDLASVNSSGVVTGLAQGTATIKATSKDNVELTTTIDITIELGNTINTLVGSNTISSLIAGGSSGTEYTTTTLSSFFNGKSRALNSSAVTATAKVYPQEDTAAMKFGTSSALGTITIAPKTNYLVSKVSVVWHRYKIATSVLTITSGALTTSATIASSVAGTPIDYTTGQQTLTLDTSSAANGGVNTFTIATTSSGYRCFVYSITIEYVYYAAV